jgi:hypothetical protein
MRLSKTLAASAGALLVGFHGWVLASQFASGRLVEPWLILRWIVAAGLVAGLVYVRRRGESLVGRKAVAIWVLAALLHAPAVAAKFGPVDIPAVPEVVMTIVVRTATLGVLTIGLWILAGLVAGIRRKPRLIAIPIVARRIQNAPDPGCATRFSPRPPPHRN